MTYILIFFSFILSLLVSLIPLNIQKIHTDEEISAIATNFIFYRNAVQNYVYENRSHTGIIDDSLLVFPYAFRNLGWNAEVFDNILYIYGESEAEVISAVKEQLKYSYAIGEKREGIFYPIRTEVVYLPDFIDENNIVSITGVTNE